MTDPALSAPIFHLSFPVRDLEEGLSYYTAKLGGVPGRRAEGWADVALFGAQLTLQHAPDDVLEPMPRSRHFSSPVLASRQTKAATRRPWLLPSKPYRYPFQ